MEEYIDIASRKSDLERTELQKEKTGVFSGCYARNPVNGEAIPVWVADYVLGRCVLQSLYKSKHLENSYAVQLWEMTLLLIQVWNGSNYGSTCT